VRESEDARVVALFFGFVGGAPKPARRFRNVAARFERLCRFEGQENAIRIGKRGPRCAQCRFERLGIELGHDRYVSSRSRVEQRAGEIGRNGSIRGDLTRKCVSGSLRKL